ncbi:sensor histidine kinase [Nocardioides mesophilus]|uniref:histidine kinase n=1 Tax=Nocardioides mesophilus TaxID=433659 RepID=A0A7G9REM7_9ACTN|nr:HAMP domain-containing sensor histidine kinase [Nocardioides mesophilus]QNN54052.1 HAMP domain-containing histidine kinase [Nocardioides mesophilus]
MTTISGAELAEPSGFPRPAQRLLVPWLAVSAVCFWWMCTTPGAEVVPYHLVWITFALAYGFEPWPVPRTLISLTVISVLTGGVLVARAADGAMNWEETTEIPLMLVLALLVVWHVQRRAAVTRTAVTLAQRAATAATRREWLGRLTSHEMRTPLTIASGYVDLLYEREDRPDRLADLSVVRDELGRLARAGDRLLRMIRLQDPLPRSPVDIDDLLEETAQRWSSVAARRWLVETSAGSVSASPERLRACLDTLIENALRYTREEDTVRLVAFRHDGQLWMGVADSGPGLTDEVARRINSRSSRTWEVPVEAAKPDPLSRTGLGIGLVQDILDSRRGRVLAGRSREGGALVMTRSPLLL